ncbi:hypothetical protein N7540_000171 [Penicillium herquei]|nr:hypothetical protein N7540_000171 [Penicillium herquei]
MLGVNLNQKIPKGHGPSREGSTSSGRRRKDYWYYESSPSKLDEVVLETKLRPRRGNEKSEVIPAPKSQYGVKREFSEDSSLSQTITKNRKLSSLAVEVHRNKSTRDNSTLSHDTDTRGSVAKTRSQNGALKNGNKNHYQGKRTAEESEIMRNNRRLKREIDLLQMHRDEQKAKLEETITHLQEANKELNAMLSHLRDIETARRNQFSSPLNEVEFLTAKLKEKDQELDAKIDQIAALDEQLSADERFQNILSDMRSDIGCSSGFSRGLAKLEEGTRQISGFLAQCLCKKRIQNLRKKPQRKPELRRFITHILGRVGMLISSPVACMRALIFSFIREHIFFSDCWLTLHCDGYVSREIQDIINQMCPRSTLESLHRAAIESLLSGDDEFEKCWIQAQVEDKLDQFLELLSPILDSQELEDMRYQLGRDLKVLFTEAFKTRSRLFAPSKAQFELVQFKAGVTFDPSIQNQKSHSIWM